MADLSIKAGSGNKRPELATFHTAVKRFHWLVSGRQVNPHSYEWRHSVRSAQHSQSMERFHIGVMATIKPLSQ